MSPAAWAKKLENCSTPLGYWVGGGLFFSTGFASLTQSYSGLTLAGRREEELVLRGGKIDFGWLEGKAGTGTTCFGQNEPKLQTFYNLQFPI